MLEVAVSIRDKGRNPISTIPADAKPPKYLLEVMELCFKVNPDERPTFRDIEALLMKRKPSGYHSADEDDDDNNMLGIGTNRKRSKSSKKIKKGKKIESDDEAIEMGPNVVSKNGTSNYGPISNQQLTNTTTGTSSSNAEKPKLLQEDQPPRPAPKYGAIGVSDADMLAESSKDAPSAESSSSSSDSDSSSDE
jgi:hypothetical protein